MKHAVLRQPLSAALVVFSLLVALFWVRHLVAPLPMEIAAENPMPAGALLAKLAGGNEWAAAAISLVFTYLTAISITRLISRNMVFQARTHTFLPLMAIVGFGLALRGANCAAVVTMYLLTRGGEYFASAFKRTARPGDLFGGGLLIGAAPLFYAPAVVFLPLIPAAMPIYLRSARETTLAIVGGLLPAFAYSYVSWATGSPFLQLPRTIAAYLTTHLPHPSLAEMGWLRSCAAAMVGLCVLLGIGAFAIDARKIRTRAYRIHLYMLLCLMLACSTLLLPCASTGDLPLIATPAAVMASAWFARYNTTTPTIAYILTITTAIVANLYFIF